MEKDFIKSEPRKKFKLKKPDYSYSKREKALIIVIVLLIITTALYALYVYKKNHDALNSIDNFEECVAAGNPVLEIYPEQCVAKGKTFTKQH